jgi:hypothetical protein
MVFEYRRDAEDAFGLFAASMRPDDFGECLDKVVGQCIKEAGEGDEIKLGKVEVAERIDFVKYESVTGGLEIESGWGIAIPFEITSGAAKGAEQEAHLEVWMQWGVTWSPG